MSTTSAITTTKGKKVTKKRKATPRSATRPASQLERLHAAMVAIGCLLDEMAVLAHEHAPVIGAIRLKVATDAWIWAFADISRQYGREAARESRKS